MTRTGRCTRSASQAIVAVLPVPVAPSSTLSLAPPLTRFSSASIASGWSPDGWKSLTIRNGATVRVNSSAGLMLSSVRLRPDSRGVRAGRSGTRLDSGLHPRRRGSMKTSIWTRWTTLAPLAGVLVLAPTWGRHLDVLIEVLIAVLLAVCVLSSVQHAEVVAHRVGEPFGSLVLAVAVTIIEVGLIVTLMVSGGSDTESLARDTVFAA